MKYVTIHSDCLIALKDLPDNSVDSLVTDPPAGISFMGKAWDDDKGGRKQWIAWMTEVMVETMRVLKPGAHGLVWALPRTSHWTATALEDAGFEVRDVVTHLFGSGFPKSLNIGKTLPDWTGWGTALKPASEHWILVRKPFSEKTVVANVLKHGVGALNIDVSRIEGQKRSPGFKNPKSELGYHGGSSNKALVDWDSSKGRFPANLVLSHSPLCQDNQCDIECAIQTLDEQSLAGGIHGAGKARPKQEHKGDFGVGHHGERIRLADNRFGDSGGASRFFYCAKISSKERNQGCEGMPDVEITGDVSLRARGVHGQTGKPNKPTVSKNHHPTVKPKKLMSYLIKLITPPGGLVLDPFMGSGSTGVAALENDFRFLGIEQSEEYYMIAQARLSG